jgi:metal-dependent amidase/aminoacylase/carboxypeptidase family protein
MDALKGIGHACGHNLIAIAGVAVACAVKAALEQFNISGKITLLGTPGQLLFYSGTELSAEGYKQPRKVEVAKSSCWKRVPTRTWMLA